MMMTLGSAEENFLEVAVAAIPRITEIITAFPTEHRAGALELAERRYMEAARDFGCVEVAARSRVSEVMRNLRTQVGGELAYTWPKAAPPDRTASILRARLVREALRRHSAAATPAAWRWWPRSAALRYGRVNADQSEERDDAFALTHGRMALRNRKYFRTNSPSRGARGAPQTRHAISPSRVSGPASALTT